MSQNPTDALRLVPLEVAQHAANNMRIAYHKTRMTREVPVSPDDLSVVLDFVKQAAPASPMPEGGGDWVDGTPEVPVGSPTWCGWVSYEIRRLRSALPSAPTGDA